MVDIHTDVDGSGLPVDDWQAHLQPDKKEGYLFFINLLRAAMLLIAFALTALVSFGFGHVLAVTLGFVILALGALSVVIDLARHAHFGLSLSVLAVALLAVAVNLS